jgi:hypothetical protein
MEARQIARELCGNEKISLNDFAEGIARLKLVQFALFRLIAVSRKTSSDDCCAWKGAGTRSGIKAQ